MDVLLFAALEHVRKRLAWRKWWRSSGLAYQRSLTDDLEREWMTLNGVAELLTQQAVAESLLENVVARLVADSPTSDLTRSLLLQHYDDYTQAPVEHKFLLWYLEGLRRMFPDVVTASPAAVALSPETREFVRQYRDAYFRPTYAIDFTVRTLDDATLWYYLQVVYGPRSSVTITVAPERGTLVYRRGDLHLRVDASSMAAPLPINLDDDYDDDVGGKAKRLATATNDVDLLIRMAALLNVMDAPLGALGDRLATAEQTFATLRVRPLAVVSAMLSSVAPGVEERRRAAAARCDTSEQAVRLNGSDLGLSTVAVVDRVHWTICWERRRVVDSHVRVAPVANAAQLLLQSRNPVETSLAGLISDRSHPVYSVSTDSDSPTCGRVIVLPTNVLLDAQSDTGDRTDRSFFMLHANDPKLASVFVRPDQDPAATHVLDLFADGRAEHAGGVEDRYLRWVLIRSLDDPESATDVEREFMAAEDDGDRLHTPNVSLMVLLRDVQCSLPHARFCVDPYMSLWRPVSHPPTAYRSGRVLPLGTQLLDLCRRHSDGLVLVGTPMSNQYSPVDSTLIWHTEAGLVPWSLNAPEVFEWKCYTVQPTERMERSDADAVQLVVQQYGPWLYVLDEPSEIQEYLRRRPSWASITAPVVRLMPLTQLPFRLYEVVNKRVFALQDGTVFVSTTPLRFATKLEPADVRATRYVSPDSSCPVRLSHGRCFSRGEMYGSEVWFPRRMKEGKLRCYDNVPKSIAPLVEWIDAALDESGQK